MNLRKVASLVILSGCSGLFGIDFEQSVSGGAGGSNAGGSNAGGSNTGGSNAGGSNAGGSNTGGQGGEGGQGGIAECGPGAAFTASGVTITAFQESADVRVIVGWIANGGSLAVDGDSFSAPSRSSFVIALDQNNGLLASRHFTSTGSLTFVDAAVSGPLIYVLGNFTGTVDEGNSQLTSDGQDGQDGLVLQLDAQLQTQWVSKLHSTSEAADDAFTSLALAPSGELIVAGGCGGQDGKVNDADATKYPFGLGGASNWACHMALQTSTGAPTGALTTPLGKSTSASYGALRASTTDLRALVPRNSKLEELDLGGPSSFTPSLVNASASNVSSGPHFLTYFNNQWFSLGNLQANQFELGLSYPSPLNLSAALLNAHAFSSSFSELGVVGQLNGQLTAEQSNWPDCNPSVPSGLLALSTYMNNAFLPGRCLLVNSAGSSALRGAIHTADGWLVAGEATGPGTFGTPTNKVLLPGSGSRLFVAQHCD